MSFKRRFFGILIVMTFLSFGSGLEAMQLLEYGRDLSVTSALSEITLQDEIGEVRVLPILPSVVFANRNYEEEILGYTGFNFALGISSRTYLGKMNASGLNFFWGFDTVLLILPSVNVGFEFVFDNGLYLGAKYMAGVVRVGVRKRTNEPQLWVAGFPAFVLGFRF